MAGIKPGEVSSILKKELEGFTTNSELEEISRLQRIPSASADEQACSHRG